MATTQQETPTRTFTCTHTDHGQNSRNLVVCIDGTSNQFGTKNTNIIELYSHIMKNDTQLTYYTSGLGAIAKFAGAPSGHPLSNKIDMVFGRNLHTVIMATYRWLSENFRDGDRIYLFGFSRGAYQVRALAGMIARVGLLLPGNNEQIPFAFELYSKTGDEESSIPRPTNVVGLPTKREGLSESAQTNGSPKKKSKHAAELAETFKKTFCRKNVHIHFVGVWDTVSSVGFGRDQTLPCTTSSCEHICYFRHALALDERRVKFLPEYVFGGRSDSTNDGRIKEVWFAGAHSDVGGGNRRNAKLQSGDIPLLWMRSQALAAGLQLEPVEVMWKIDDLDKEITPSLNPGWWVLELLPLKHLLYYNSNKNTHKPHLGGPRMILPGQKVHVSALFKHNYKPYAQFYGTSEKWPGPMFWNDPNSHKRLQGLSDYWEKDLFDDCSIKTLLGDLVQERGQANLDVLDRLAFMANFDVSRNAISAVPDSKATLAAFLQNENKLVRLSAAVTYCELGWDWTPTMQQTGLSEKIKNDIEELLKSKDSRENRRACMSLPSLCRQHDLKTRLVSQDCLRRIISLCDSGRVAKHEEGTSSVAFHSAQALSMLMKSDSDLALTLIKMDAISDIIEALHDKSGPVLVSVLRIMDGLAKHADARPVMKTAFIIPTLLKLAKQFDDFVAPAAVRVLCSLQEPITGDQEKNDADRSTADLRETMLQSGVLSTFLDMLNHCSADTKQVASDALVEFAKHDENRRALIDDGHLHTLATRAQSHITHKRDGAIMTLVALSEKGQVRAAVKAAITKARTIETLVARLKQKSNALSAASALAGLVKIDDVATMVIAEGLNVPAHINNMLRRRWFDGSHGEDGINVLWHLFECERLRSIVLKSGAVDVLCNMLAHGNDDTVYAALHYLRTIARFEYGKSALRNDDKLVSPLLRALRIPRQKVQRIAIEILRGHFEEENLRENILAGLLDLLTSRTASDVFISSTMLRLLAPYKFVRDEVSSNDAFWNLSNEYYNMLNLTYDKKGPRFEEVYESVGLMVTIMQEGECSRRSNDKWLEPAPYEL